jgi:hypothetical protein
MISVPSATAHHRIAMPAESPGAMSSYAADRAWMPGGTVSGRPLGGTLGDPGTLPDRRCPPRPSVPHDTRLAARGEPTAKLTSSGPSSYPRCRANDGTALIRATTVLATTRAKRSSVWFPCFTCGNATGFHGFDRDFRAFASTEVFGLCHVGPHYRSTGSPYMLVDLR